MNKKGSTIEFLIVIAVIAILFIFSSGFIITTIGSKNTIMLAIFLFVLWLVLKSK